MNELDYSIVGMRFGRLTVTRFSHMSSAGNPYWECECDCGDRIVAAEDRLLRGKVKSCGCQPRGRTRTDLTGRRFGRLVVLGFDHSTVRNDLYWLCRCDCGNEALFRTRELLDGTITSCGCKNGNPNYFGNKSYDSLYVIWRNMKKRCENINDRAYKNYGGRGIYLCDEWQYFKNFRSWALTNGYDNGLTIDRIDNDDGYYPENCRWVDDIVQANNRRSNHYVSYAGSTHSIAEWSRILDVDYQRLLRSINKGDMIYFEKYYDNYNEE